MATEWQKRNNNITFGCICICMCFGLSIFLSFPIVFVRLVAVALVVITGCAITVAVVCVGKEKIWQQHWRYVYVYRVHVFVNGKCIKFRSDTCKKDITATQTFWRFEQKSVHVSPHNDIYTCITIFMYVYISVCLYIYSQIHDCGEKACAKLK